MYMPVLTCMHTYISAKERKALHKKKQSKKKKQKKSKETKRRSKWSRRL